MSESCPQSSDSVSPHTSDEGSNCGSNGVTASGEHLLEAFEYLGELPLEVITTVPCKSNSATPKGKGNGSLTPRNVFTYSERTILKDIVIKYKDIVDTRQRSRETFQEKQQAWRNIVDDYNATADILPRTVKELRKCWDNMKYRARQAKKNQEEQMHTHMLEFESGGVKQDEGYHDPRDYSSDIIVEHMELLRHAPEPHRDEDPPELKRARLEAPKLANLLLGPLDGSLLPSQSESCFDPNQQAHSPYYSIDRQADTVSQSADRHADTDTHSETRLSTSSPSLIIDTEQLPPVKTEDAFFESETNYASMFLAGDAKGGKRSAEDDASSDVKREMTKFHGSSEAKLELTTFHLGGGMTITSQGNAVVPAEGVTMDLNKASPLSSRGYGSLKKARSKKARYNGAVSSVANHNGIASNNHHKVDSNVPQNIATNNLNNIASNIHHNLPHNNSNTSARQPSEALTSRFPALANTSDTENVLLERKLLKRRLEHEELEHKLRTQIMLTELQSHANQNSYWLLKLRQLPPDEGTYSS